MIVLTDDNDNNVLSSMCMRLGGLGGTTSKVDATIFPLVEEDSSNPKDLIGAKKLSTTALPDVAVAHANHAMMNGARKYGPYNWRKKKVRASIYVEAARRHLMQWLDREENASDSQVHHLGHAMASIAIILDAQEYGCLIDDRPEVSGGLTRVLERINKQISEGK